MHKIGVRVRLLEAQALHVVANALQGTKSVVRKGGSSSTASRLNTFCMAPCGCHHESADDLSNQAYHERPLEATRQSCREIAVVNSHHPRRGTPPFRVICVGVITLVAVVKTCCCKGGPFRPKARKNAQSGQ